MTFWRRPGDVSCRRKNQDSDIKKNISSAVSLSLGLNSQLLYSTPEYQLEISRAVNIAIFFDTLQFYASSSTSPNVSPNDLCIASFADPSMQYPCPLSRYRNSRSSSFE